MSKPGSTPSSSFFDASTSSFSSFPSSPRSPLRTRSPRSECMMSDFSRLTAFGARMVSMVIDGARKEVGA